MTQPSGSDPGPPDPEQVADLVQSLATVMRQSAITELDLDLGDVSVRLRRPAPSHDGAKAESEDDHPGEIDRGGASVSLGHSELSGT